MQAWAEAIGDPTPAKIQSFKTRIAEHRDLGTDLFAVYFLVLLADLALTANQTDACHAALDEAETFLNSTGERWCETEVYRLQGKLLVAQTSDHAEAERSYAKALAIAGQRRAKSFELRAAISLARLWQQQAKMDQALELLTPLYHWFIEGFETADLREAKALIDTLS